MGELLRVAQMLFVVAPHLDDLVLVLLDDRETDLVSKFADSGAEQLGKKNLVH